ncbi:MAG: prepilin-type N-terminal cleavage/methylation domain-containing protein [Candidatus Omnitrophota bacterium]
MKTRSKGFTLIEVLITIVVITVGIIALSEAFNKGQLTLSDVESVRIAMNIAQEKMEEVSNTSFGSLADSGPAADADFPDFSVEVDVAGGQNPMQVDVTVTWQARGGQASTTLTTLVSDV